MKNIIILLLIILTVTNLTIAQRKKVPINTDFYNADMYDLHKNNGNPTVSRTINTSWNQGPNIGTDPINNCEECGFRVIHFDGYIGGNPQATRTGDKAQLIITMNNVYEPQHQFFPVYTQSSWITHYYVVVLLDNSIANLSSPNDQWSAVWSNNATVVATRRYDDLTPIDLSSLINNSTSDRITFGIRAVSSNDPINNPWSAPSSSIFRFIGTALWDVPTIIKVKNNFLNGTIKAQVNNSNPPTVSAPAIISDITSKTLYMGAVEGQIIDNYIRIWNDTKGPINPSNWFKQDPTGQRLSNFSQNVNTNIVLSYADSGYSYVADMMKMCNVTFQGKISAVYNNNNYNYNESGILNVVEGNTFTATSSTYFTSPTWITKTFINWTWPGGSNSSPNITQTVNSHITYTANYSGVACADPMNIHFTSTDGNPIIVAWTEHPDPNVTQYQIWRKVKGGSASAIGAVNRGTTSFTDVMYLQNNYNGTINLSYTVKAYYEPSSTWNDPGYYSITGDYQGFEKNKNNTISMNLAKEIPTEYKLENYPNPFNPTTVINYQLPKDGYVKLKVYDMLGREIATLVNENQNAGYYKVNFDASRLTSGVYIYTINANNFFLSKKMLLMK